MLLLNDGRKIPQLAFGVCGTQLSPLVHVEWKEKERGEKRKRETDQSMDHQQQRRSLGKPPSSPSANLQNMELKTYLIQNA